MIMKRQITLLLLLLTSLFGVAQVTNQAIEFAGNGRVSLGVLPDDGSADGTTVQFWMCPREWSAGAHLLTWGNDLDVLLGRAGELVITCGDKSVAFANAGLKVGVWAHITLSIDGEEVSLLVNNTAEQITALAAPFVVPTDEPLLLGGGFIGRIDEVRVWNGILSVDYNRFWNNTIDHLCPSWSRLVGYWKFDQSRLATNVYDYSGNGHNGTFSAMGVMRVSVDDNSNFVYRRNLAYSDCSRFFDRGIQQGQYLKSNVISMIGGTAQADGSVKYKQPDNKGVITGGCYRAEYEGRTGVLDLEGEGAQMNTGKEALIAYNNNLYLDAASAYTFMTWLSLDTWTPNAFLLKKESVDDNGISLRLGDTEGAFVLRCNGVEFTYTTTFSLNTWHHIGFSTAAATLGGEFVFVLDGAIVEPAYTHTEVASTTLSGLRSTDCLIGAGIDGKLDETITWTQSFDAVNIIAQGSAPLEPGIGKSILGAYSRSVDGRWKYDVPEDLGRDSYSTPEWFRMIKAAFEGYEGAYVTISLDKYADEFFTKINGDANYREKLAKSIAAMGNEPFLDGVDYDFEWNNNWTGIGTLCQLVRAQLQPGKIQAVSPHELYYNFPTDKMQYVDYFNFQNYGPNSKNIFNFDNYKSFFTKAKNHSYPVDKIMLSYATTTSGALYSNGSRPAGSHKEFYPTGWRSMPYTTFAYDQNSYEVGEGLTRYFTGMEQVWLRSELMNNNGCAGIFYWDMGNDTPESDDSRSLATFASYAINSNVQKIVENVATAAEAPAEYVVQAGEKVYYRIRGGADGHTTHYMYQNGDLLYAGTDGTTAVTGIICFEKAGSEDNTYYLKGNDGRYIQDRTGLGKNDANRFGTEPVLYSVKQKEGQVYEGQHYFEQVYYTAHAELTDVQRCLMCNGDNVGVSTWGPGTASAHWVVEPLIGYDIYTLVLIGVEAVTYEHEGYTGSEALYNGGFIAVPTGSEIASEDIISTTEENISVSIDPTGKTVTITPAAMEIAPYYRIRSADGSHISHYMYQNENLLYAGTNGKTAVTGIFHLEKAGDAADTYNLKANDGRYIQDRSALTTTNDTYQFGKEPVLYVLKSSEYNYPEGHYCFEQVEYTPGKSGFTDVQRCLKCNGDNAGVSTWGPWTAASHWIIEPLNEYDIYTLVLIGVESVTYGPDGYTGSETLYNGGFIAVPEGEAITVEAVASTDGETIDVFVDEEKGIIRVTKPVVDTEKVYIIRCDADPNDPNHGNHYFIADAGDGVINGRSDTGTLFRFVATADENDGDAYYLQSVVSSKYISENGGNVAITDVPTTAWIVSTHDFKKGVVSFALNITEHKYLNNNAAGTEYGLKIATHPGGIAAINGCSLWQLTPYDVPTGVECQELDAHDSGLFFDLMGRRVINPTKGLYIVNGKKVVVGRR